MGLFGNIKKRANAQTSHARSNFLAGRKIAPIVKFELLGDQDRENMLLAMKSIHYSSAQKKIYSLALFLSLLSE